MSFLVQAQMFHRRGEACEKDRSPHEWLDVGSLRKLELQDQSLCHTNSGLTIWVGSSIYAGALLVSNLYTRSWNLYLIHIIHVLRLTSNQCNSFKIGVIWQDFLVKVITRAALVWIRWRLSIWVRKTIIEANYTYPVWKLRQGGQPFKCTQVLRCILC